MSEILLALKTVAAAAAVVAASGALGVRWWAGRERWHRRAGWLFCAAMVVLALAWLASAAVAASPMRAVAALLLLYPAGSGLGHARRGDRPPGWPEAVAAWSLLLLGVGLFVWGTRAMLVDEAVLAGLGWLGLATLAVILAGPDVRSQFTTEEDRGPARVVNHLAMMLAGTFAALTSLLITLAPTQFAIIGTILALFVAVHLMVHWSSRVLGHGLPPRRE